MYQHIPNTLSVLRIGIACGIFLLFFLPHSLISAQILIVTALCTDKLDGTLARLWHVESDLGKRLESIADPLFGISGYVYVIFFLHLPLYFIIIAICIVVLPNIARVIIRVWQKRLFYQKSPLTRFGVGIGYIVLLLYIFAIPYREWVLPPALFYGVFAAINYIRMMVQFVKKIPTPPVLR